jgi:hypothetical protein
MPSRLSRMVFDVVNALLRLIQTGEALALLAQVGDLGESLALIHQAINALDANLKARIAEQNNSRGRLSFKSVEEIDNQMPFCASSKPAKLLRCLRKLETSVRVLRSSTRRREKEVDSGTLRLVDERKTLTEVSNLRKQRKSFAGLDDLFDALE